MASAVHEGITMAMRPHPNSFWRIEAMTEGAQVHILDYMHEMDKRE